MFFIGIALLVFGIVILSNSRRLGPEVPKGGAKGAGWLMAVFGSMLVLTRLFVTIDSGNVGVVKVFGKVDPRPLTEGLNVVNPLAEVTRVSVRTQEYTMSAIRSEGATIGDDAVRTLSKDGLPLPLDITITYRPNPSSVPWLFRHIGSEADFIAKIIRPSSRAAVRDAVATFSAQEAYSTKREQLSIAITKNLETYVQRTLETSEGYTPGALIVQQVLVRNIELPEKLKQSIEAKLTAEQESLRMQYVLDREKQEAERKRIEARGIADFQAIVSQGLTEKLLQWKGIEATQELATSTNSKVVIIGAGKSGLPVILNTDGAIAAK